MNAVLRHFLAVCAAVGLLSTPARAEPTARMCIDNYPPFHAFPKAGGAPFGTYVTLAQEIGKKSGFSVTFTPDTPFKRCLELMKAGEVDLMLGILDRDDRRSYMNMVEYKGRSDKLFLMAKGQGESVKTFADLKGKRVGSLVGFKYFAQFDDDKGQTFTREEVSTLDQNLAKLKAGRLDAVVVTRSQYDALQRTKPAVVADISLAAFVHDKPNPVYLAVSKASPLAAQFTAIETTVTAMYKSAEIEAIEETVLSALPTQ